MTIRKRKLRKRCEKIGKTGTKNAKENEDKEREKNMCLEVEYLLSKFKYFALYNNTKEVLISGIMLYFHNIFLFSNIFK